MGKVIAIGVVVVIMLVAFLWFLGWDARRADRQEDKRAGRPVKGDLNAAQEKELIAMVHDANTILSRLGVNFTDEDALYDPEVIRASTRREVTAWTARYTNWKGTK